MFFILSKLFGVLLHPLFWIVVLGCWGIFTKNARRKKILQIIAVCLAFFCSNKVLVNELAIAWEPGVIKRGASNPKVAVVLGGYAEFDKIRNRVQFTEAADRLFEAVRLYKNNIIDTVLLSGGASSFTGRLKPESLYVKDYLISIGIDSNDIWIDTASKNTWENALYSKKVLETHHYSDGVLLVTSAFHMRRAAGCFHKIGVNASPHPVQFIGNKGRGYLLGDYIIPSAEALMQWDALFKEFFGILVYKITGKA